MKIIFLISFLYTFILANQSQIVLCTLAVESNVAKAKKSINTLINKDEKFQSIFNQNSLKTVSKKRGKYFIVSIEPFNDRDTMLSVLKIVKKMKFEDAYISKLPQETALNKPFFIDNPLYMNKADLNSINVITLKNIN